MANNSLWVLQLGSNELLFFLFFLIDNVAAVVHLLCSLPLPLLLLLLVLLLSLLLLLLLLMLFVPGYAF
ncbi:MAG: hypothetical protein J3R72DRAFT_447569 [Linnemannia gamsii]|nr:MAG: hypothetical protein J3R72DRAFT_447569 [Linnemannia gamsii]